MKLSVFFAWFDFWIGGYFDRKDRTLYVCLVPMVVIRIHFLPRRCECSAVWGRDPECPVHGPEWQMACIYCLLDGATLKDALACGSDHK